MAEFLSDEFFEQAQTTLRNDPALLEAAAGASLSVQFDVTDGPSGDVSYGFTIIKGAVDVISGPLDNPTVTIRNDYRTAVEISSGEINTQVAFIKGRLRIDGDRAALLSNQEVIQRFSTAMARLDVTY